MPAEEDDQARRIADAKALAEASLPSTRVALQAEGRGNLLIHDDTKNLAERRKKLFPVTDSRNKRARLIFFEEEEPSVAAASLGQVYRGKLRSSGDEVAVKVQRPGLDDKICVDMYIFRQFAQLLDVWARRNLGCNISLVVDEFGAKLWEEANYAVEAINAQNFARNFEGDPMVKIPKIYGEFTSEKVITMEWIGGVKSTNLAELRRAGIDVDAFISNGVQAALRQLLGNDLQRVIEDRGSSQQVANSSAAL